FLSLFLFPSILILPCFSLSTPPPLVFLPSYKFYDKPGHLGGDGWREIGGHDLCSLLPLMLVGMRGD
ncbi:unnamed protein product, partial [Musa acuminata subsp. burmannicoides]